jgi:hypothetical protein
MRQKVEIPPATDDNGVQAPHHCREKAVRRLSSLYYAE